LPLRGAANLSVPGAGRAVLGVGSSVVIAD